MSSQLKVAIWSSTTCQICMNVKQFLLQQGVSFTDFDMKKNDFLRDIVEAKYGVRKAPVIEIGDGSGYEAVIGPDYEKLTALIEKYSGKGTARIHFSSTNKSVEFEEGKETNILRASIRYEGGIPYRCGGGLCGTCKIHVDEGAENLTGIKKQEVARLGDDLQKGYRLACQTFAKGDVKISWDTTVNVKVPPKVKALWEQSES